MQKNFFISFTALALLCVVFFVPFNSTTEIESVKDLSEIHSGEFETLTDYFNVDEVVSIDNKLNENGTYSVTVTSLRDGKLVNNSFEALDYSPDATCGCRGCNEWAPYGNAYKRKLVIGTKCWCLYCLHEPKRPG